MGSAFRANRIRTAATIVLMACIGHGASGSDAKEADDATQAAKAAQGQAAKAVQDGKETKEAAARDLVVAKLKKLRPNLPITRIADAPVPGMISIELTGGGMLYATEDGRYVIAGDLYEMTETELTTPIDVARNAERVELMSRVRREDMAVFAPAHTKAVITVFTDIDCGYCRKLHLEVPRLNELGIEVRYLAFPRGGLDSPAYSKMVTAWCSTNRNDAITRMKRGEELKPISCDNPVAEEYELGIALGVGGTPAILLEDGSLLPGYAPADELAKTLGI